MANGTDIKNAAAATVTAATYEMPNGHQAPMVQPLGYDYEYVAASASNQVLGASGASGDLINGIHVIPGTTAPGSIILKDGSTSPDVGITVFVGGTTTIVPFWINLGIRSVSGAWSITTGSNVSCVAVGDFT